ncbi:MAG: LysM peptidoglycan-binding domain-containing protein [Betaproteobacteria bacterium]|nr:LysM peptidoglycan-binding domain-containing protein [Betaproteobacteria bacterium]
MTALHQQRLLVKAGLVQRGLAIASMLILPALTHANPTLEGIVESAPAVNIMLTHPVDGSVHDKLASTATDRLMPPVGQAGDPLVPHENAGSLASPIQGSSEGAAIPETSTARPTDLWQRIRAGFAMPDLDSKLVKLRQQEYMARPQMVKLLVERSRKYLFHIVEEIERRGLPTELALLPMVESAFNPMAYSRAHASGLWQFIPSTGREYNLEQDWWYDARRDVVASTGAALDYLQKIHEMHGDWHLALASYNFGEWGVARMVEYNRRLGKPVDFSNLRLPMETKHYVPRLQALKNIVANPEKFGILLDPIPNEPYFATVTLSEDIDLVMAARLAEMSVEDLIALNPGHNRPVASSAKTPILVLPAERLVSFSANLAAHDQPLSAWRIYHAQKGERLEEIAASHKISLDQLRQVNGVRGTGRLQMDARLLVPAGASAPAPLATLFKAPTTISAEFAPRMVKHVVRVGETWQAIATKYRVRIMDLQSWNGGVALIAGHSLVVHQAAAPVRTPAHKNSNSPRSTVGAAAPARKSVSTINVANR